jgi:transposase
MNTHKNARLTYLRRVEMVQDITEQGLSASDAAAQHGVSAVTARKLLGRYLADGAMEQRACWTSPRDRGVRHEPSSRT